MIYLDNAATSFPKPPSVYREAEKCMKTYCGNPGRSSHRMSLAAAEKIYECRSVLSDFFNSGAPERVIFTSNTTSALNIIIKGILRDGDHVITGNTEHNSVLRVLYALKGTHRISVSKVNTLTDEDDIIDQISRLINPDTRAVIMAHSGNVIPYVLPIAKIGRLCRQNGILFILDGAQSAGIYDIDMKNDCIDALCIPSHKGLYGIQGAGALCISDTINEKHILSFTEGGNGTASFDPSMPDFLPDRLESGTLPTPAIASLCEGVKYIKNIKTETVRQINTSLCSSLCERLSSVSNVTVYNGKYIGSTVLFNINGIPSEAVASHLDKSGICVRGGFHCAPGVHTVLGTEKSGAVRASFGIFNKHSDIERLYSAVKNIVNSSI